MNEHNKPGWEPCTNQDVLIARAEMLADIRAFFKQKQLLEVDTPALSQGTITDVYLEPMISQCQSIGQGNSTIYLQTSPEFAMKRLLSAGSGSIYQICRAFRDDESGRYHNPEFLMLEWYRVGYDHWQIMSEMDELLVSILNCKAAEIISYQQIFLYYLQIDPLSIPVQQLQEIVIEKTNGPKLEDRDQMLQCLFSTLIEPELGHTKPIMIHDFPASQAALACMSILDPRVAERFEVYFQGVELANGFHELTDADEQRQRFLADNQQRKLQNKQLLPLDERFLAALDSGMPDCAGVAMGLDRLLMLKLKKQSISEVMPFPIDRA